MLGQLYVHDAEARERGLTPDERLQLHQERSRPVMDKLHAWLEAQLAERRTEPNSGLGQAIGYLLRHWKPLTLFLRMAAAPLDNNIAERALKRAILHRNYVHSKIMRTSGERAARSRELAAFSGRGSSGPLSIRECSAVDAFSVHWRTRCLFLLIVHGSDRVFSTRVSMPRLTICNNNSIARRSSGSIFAVSRISLAGLPSDGFRFAPLMNP